MSEKFFLLIFPSGIKEEDQLIEWEVEAKERGLDILNY